MDAKANLASKKRRTFPRRGMPDKEGFISKLLGLDRVTRVSAGGRRLRFRATVIVGNKAGKVGIGMSKGPDVAQAIEKATKLARKNLIEVIISKGTIPHQVEAKFGAAKVLLKPQYKGKGLVAGGTVRVICDLAGIQDISSKIIGRTSNKLNNAQATISALKKLKNSLGRKDEYAATRNSASSSVEEKKTSR